MAGLITSVLLRQILRPLSAIARSSGRIAAGRYDEREAVPPSDELATVARSFNQMAASLEQVEQQRVALIGNVAHELRTPLTGIEGYLERLVDGVFKPEPDTFDDMQREVRRLRRLVDDLQALSHVEAGQVHLRLADVDLAAVAQRVVAQLSPQIAASGLKLSVRAGAEPIVARADPDRLAQILLNLLGNAVRYTPEGGSIIVRVGAEPGGRAMVEVIDSGAGIAAEDLALIFERFYRVDRSRARASGGSGIGLTIARHLAWAMGGDLAAASAGPGPGQPLHAHPAARGLARLPAGRPGTRYDRARRELTKGMAMYEAAPGRYEQMTYRRSGRSGLLLPAISLGLWHNFGGVDRLEDARAMLRRAFDLGITHIDLANNYGPPPGSAEETFGRVLRDDLRPYRDELIISSKAGYGMWPGPYGDWGSRKYLVASLDQSLRRMGLEYVDIFYHHRPDPDTPLEETMGALDQIVRSGKALYAGISNYPAEQTRQAAQILRRLGTPCLIHQPSYSMFNRWIEGGLLDALRDEGVGCIVFSPLAQGLLSDKYLGGVPEGSRAAKAHGFLRPEHITDEKIAMVQRLNGLAQGRGQTLAQLALAWALRDPAVTSALIGASRPEQIEDAAGALRAGPLTEGELAEIEAILGG